MKKVLALVLMVCLVAMSVCAFAAEAMQDQMPPSVIGVRLYDAQGNLIEEITGNGGLTLTDVSAREEGDNAVVVLRLSEAYKNVMENVHHSDVECLLHDHDNVKVDINMVLMSLNKDIDAHDLVMYELFDVDIVSDMAEKIKDGGYMEVTMDVLNTCGAPLITMFTPDGANWQVVPSVGNGDRVTVKLETAGTLAFLCDGTLFAGLGSEEEVITYVPGTDGTTTGGNFTPSVSGKPAPQIVPVVGEDGQTYIGYIRNDDGYIEIKVPNRNYVQVTGAAERSYIPDLQTFEHLEWAFNSILNAADVGELYTTHDMSVLLADADHQTLGGAIDAALAQMGSDLTHDQLVVKDLFEVTAYGDFLHYLYDDNFYLEVTFDAQLDPSKPLVVIHSTDSIHWHVHPIEECVVNEDGTVMLHMYDLGAVAFLVPAEDDLNVAGAVQAP